MKKLFSFCLPLLLAVVSLGVLTGCNDSGKDLKGLLSTVPGDAPVVVTVQLDPVLNQIDFKKDGDKYTFCKEVKEVLDLAGADKKLINALAGVLDVTNKNMVVFADPDKAETGWITFGIEDAETFIDRFNAACKQVDNDKIDFDKDGDYYIADGEQCVIKGKQVWICPDKRIDTDDIEEFLKLGDKSFASTHGKLADRMATSDNVFSTFLGFDDLASFIRKNGDETLAMQMKGALSLAYDDAAYGLLTTTLDDQGAEMIVDVLNSEYKPAKFNLPVSQIDRAALAKLNNAAPLVAAMAISSEQMEKITGLLATMSGTTVDSMPELKLLQSIAGTIGFSMSDMNDWTLSIPFKNGDDANSAAQLVGLTSNQASVAGNYLIVRGEGATSASGSAPDAFKGQMMAARLDLAKLPESIITGADLSKLGTLTLIQGEIDGGLRASLKWDIRRLIPTLLSVGRTVATDYATGKVTFPIADGSYEREPDNWYDDSVEVEEAWEYEEAVPATDSIAW